MDGGGKHNCSTLSLEVCSRVAEGSIASFFFVNFFNHLTLVFGVSATNDHIYNYLF